MSAPKEQNENPKRVRSASRPAASVNMEELRELIALLRDNGLAGVSTARKRGISRVFVATPQVSGNRPIYRDAFSCFCYCSVGAYSSGLLRRRLLAQRIRARRHQQKLLRIRIYTSFRLRLWARSIVRLSDRGAFREDRK